MRDSTKAKLSDLLAEALAMVEQAGDDRRNPCAVMMGHLEPGWSLRTSTDHEGRWHYYLVAPAGWAPAPWDRPAWTDGTSQGRRAWWRSSVASAINRGDDPDGFVRLEADDPANTERMVYLLGLSRLTSALVEVERWKAGAER